MLAMEQKLRLAKKEFAKYKKRAEVAENRVEQYKKKLESVQQCSEDSVGLANREAYLETFMDLDNGLLD